MVQEQVFSTATRESFPFFRGDIFDQCAIAVLAQVKSCTQVPMPIVHFLQSLLSNTPSFMDYLLTLPAQQATALKCMIIGFSQHSGAYVHRLVKPAMVPYIAAWMLETQSSEASESWLRICTLWKKVNVAAGSTLRTSVHRITGTKKDHLVDKWRISATNKETTTRAELVLGQRVEHAQRGYGSVCMVDHTLKKCYHVQYDSGEQHSYSHVQASLMHMLHLLVCPKNLP